MTYPDTVLAVAREHARTPLSGHTFTELEARVLRPFFTNLDRRVFFIHTLPPNVGATLLSMFSRMKNPRGLRGVFVDRFLPQFLASQLDVVERMYGGEETAFLQKNRIATLDAFAGHSREARESLEKFLRAMTVDPAYLQQFAGSKKVKQFLETNLDAFGHRSIARMASAWVCFEKISVLAAKSIEWGRPGAGYIELSTRFVDMSAAGCYPIHRELETGWKVPGRRIEEAHARAFRRYTEFSGDPDGLDGPFPTFLRERFGHLYADAPADLSAGVKGETCDVLGNFLPASTLTSVAACVSGEAFPTLLTHLLLDGTPENIALVEMIREEAERIGAQQFARHVEPTAWVQAHWRYLRTDRFRGLARCSVSHAEPVVSYGRADLERPVSAMFFHPGDGAWFPVGEFIERSPRFHAPRADVDRLPAEFEAASVAFRGVMSFRGWRDLHRMGFCTHHRTPVTPCLGSYRYDKHAPDTLREAFAEQHAADRALWETLGEAEVPSLLAQYPMTLGNRVGFTLAANLREIEFCTWQRGKFSVNHEVRQVFLSIERYLRDLLPWWKDVSRCDTTPAYVFARGENGIPFPPVEESEPAVE